MQKKLYLIRKKDFLTIHNLLLKESLSDMTSIQSYAICREYVSNPLSFCSKEFLEIIAELEDVLPISEDDFGLSTKTRLVSGGLTL